MSAFITLYIGHSRQDAVYPASRGDETKHTSYPGDLSVINVENKHFMEIFLK